MSEFNMPVVEVTDTDIVFAALDAHIEAQRAIDVASPAASDSSASAAIRRASDARYHLERELGITGEMSAEEREHILAGRTGSIILGAMTRSEFAEILQAFSDQADPHSDFAKRAEYIADQLDS